MPNDRNEPAVEPTGDKKGPPSDLWKASEDLKTKIAEAKRRNDMPLDSALGNPNWEKNAADGHLDRARGLIFLGQQEKQAKETEDKEHDGADDRPGRDSGAIHRHIGESPLDFAERPGAARRMHRRRGHRDVADRDQHRLAADHRIWRRRHRLEGLSWLDLARLLISARPGGLLAWVLVLKWLLPLAIGIWPLIHAT